MKKYFYGLLTLLLIMTSYTAVSAESRYLTLPQLCAQAPERWTQSYETP